MRAILPDFPAPTQLFQFSLFPRCTWERKKEELDLLRSQIGTTDLAKTRALPYAFAEQGVYMLATVINSSTAIATSKNIMRTFTKLREFSKHYNILAKQIMVVERKSDKQYKELKKALDELIAASDVVDEKVIGFLK